MSARTYLAMTILAAGLGALGPGSVLGNAAAGAAAGAAGGYIYDRVKDKD